MVTQRTYLQMLKKSKKDNIKLDNQDESMSKDKKISV
jgi:hypothetical protein